MSETDFIMPAATRDTLGVLGVKLEAIKMLVSAWITSMFVPQFSAFSQHH
jgi:hypothetical protein